MKNNWMYDICEGWAKITDLKAGDLDAELRVLGYSLDPSLVLGDEFNFIAIYDHPEREEYLFHLIIEEFSKVLYANSLPAMIQVMKDLTDLLNAYFDTLAAVNGDDECLD